MAEVLFNGNGVVSLGSVHGEDDLKPHPGVNINPPPDEGTCDCCGLRISQLKPFGKAGDPLVGDFDGAYLVKRRRWAIYYDEEQMQAGEGENNICSSWECRDCVGLSEKEYHDKRNWLYRQKDAERG